MFLCKVKVEFKLCEDHIESFNNNKKSYELIFEYEKRWIMGAIEACDDEEEE